MMLDMIIRCGGRSKTTFVFINTGLEYQATIDHIDFLESKYGIKILRKRAATPIPTAVKKYGVPFWSKYASDMLHRLQYNNFKFEDKPYEELILEYPNCKTALEWWCNKGEGTTMYVIDRAPYLKEFMVNNPPKIKFSHMCCDHAKKKVMHSVEKTGKYDMTCVGVRKAEGGIRSAHKHCFSEGKLTDQFRPIFWFRDSDKEEYCRYYDVSHSRCYTEYGLERTGCFGCPFGKRFEEELLTIAEYEPRLLKAANAIFGDSYEYTRRYLAFRNYKREVQANGK